MELDFNKLMIELFIKWKGEVFMEFASKIAIWTFINLALILTFAGLVIYVLILLIKALKIYINKNS